MTRVIIICAGDGIRWNNYLRVPKHLIEIGGETLLHRSVRLLLANNIRDIYVVSKNSNNHSYKLENTKQYIAKLNPENEDTDKFLSSKELWNFQGRTIVLYGDCYFSESAINKIAKYESRNWTLFCRPWGSQLTGCIYGECFAQSFYPEDIPKHEKALYKTLELKKSGKIERCGGWEHLKVMCGFLDPDMNEDYDDIKVFVIDDWTEDFDLPADYEQWVERRKAKNLRI